MQPVGATEWWLLRVVSFQSNYYAVVRLTD